MMMMMMKMNKEFFLCVLLNHGLWMILDVQTIVMKENLIRYMRLILFSFAYLCQMQGKLLKEKSEVDKII